MENYPYTAAKSPERIEALKASGYLKEKHEEVEEKHGNINEIPM